MKKISILLFIISFATSLPFAMDEDGWSSTYESISAFDNTNPIYGNRPLYVKPIITNIGSILNSNWAISSGVPKSFSIEAGLPFAIVPINDSDREYGNNNPTIFGGNDINNAYRITTDACTPEALALYGGCSVVNGNENLNNLNAFTYPFIQLASSIYHARVVLRGMFLPSISQLKKFNLFGFGLQYSFGHFFQYLLPRIAQPFDISILFSYSKSTIGYKPDDFTGTLDLDISAYTMDFIIGYKPFNFIEAMLTLGYQYANMKSGGHLINEIDPFTQIHPNITVKGNNGFHFGFEVAFQFGSYHPVIGYDYVGKSSFTTNIFYYKQTFGKDKTPAEIAKEKNATNKQENTEENINVVKNDSENHSEDNEENTSSDDTNDSSENEADDDTEETSEDNSDETTEDNYYNNEEF